MDNDNFKKWSENLSSILPKSAKEAKEDIQKNLSFLIKEAIQKMDLVERSEIDAPGNNSHNCEHTIGQPCGD